jgi:hypothetical protein
MIELPPATKELIEEVVTVVSGLRHAGVRGFVPTESADSRLQRALQNVEEIKRRVLQHPSVSVDILLSTRELLNQLHRAVADGVLDPRGVPFRLVEAQEAIARLIRASGHGDRLAGAIGHGSRPGQTEPTHQPAGGHR